MRRRRLRHSRGLLLAARGKTFAQRQRRVPGGQKAVCILWAAPTEGEAGWYTYDKKEGTLQRYHATPSESEGVVTTPTAPQKPTANADGEAEEKEALTLGAFFGTYRQPLLIALVVVAGIAVVIIVILMVSAGGRKKGKH